MMDYREAARVVAREMGLPEDEVLKVYKSFWRFIRERASSLPLKENLTDEELLKLRPYFNIPSLGKYGCPPERYHRQLGKVKHLKIPKDRKVRDEKAKED